MADKDDLKLDIEEQVPAEDPSGSEFAGDGQPISSEEGGSQQRVLLLLLLLLVVAVGGAAWLYFSNQPTQTPLTGAGAPVESKTLPVPARETAPAPAEVADEVDVPVAAPVEVAPPPEPAPQPAATPTREAPAQPQPEIAQEPQEPGAAAVPVVEPPAAAPAVVTTPEPPRPAPPAAPTGEYTVQVGAYAEPATLATAKSRVQGLGFEPLIREAQTIRNLFRLRVGTFFPSQGEAKLGEIRMLSGAEPFFLMDGDLMVVYAGTFQSQERARQVAARLQQQGVHVEEEQIRATVPLSIVRFGDFATRAEAERAAAQARQAGMDALVVKRR
ncbi:SPOR domain-containing protein [Geoalkalibacter halelectricus]|uniref:SPOR domain-containing protein n=1 Tax=Geoalkalibacter halelectricus TaxID=2847045 RepID=UPI003D196510